MLEKIKKRIKDNLLIKIEKQKKEIKVFKEKIAEDVLKEKSYIDKINLLQDDIRSLTLKLSEEDREFWLKERNYKDERNIIKKKRIKTKISSTKNTKV